MKKLWRKIGILGAVFIASLLIFSRFTNQETRDLTADMEPASLPVVYLTQQGVRINELHGYVADMDAVTMPDAIVPVLDDNKIQLEISASGEEIRGISYEVRTLDASRLVEEEDSVELQESGKTKGAQLVLQDLLQEGTEYLLQIDLEQGTDTIHYYTKIMKEGSFHTMECVEFAQDFHNKTMNKEDSGQLSIYLEPDSQADNTTLQKVSIKNKLSQIAWGDLEVKETAGAVISIKEMTEDYNTIVMKDIISAADEDGTVSYYNVEEYYRVRKGIERMYLLDYERTVEEFFEGNSSNIASNAIHLGIRSEDVDFRSNETGSSVCFVQQGELWAYSQDTNQLIQVFSFRSMEGIDARENYDQHDIRIVKTDEGGGIDFIVYGYMNRGLHEGESGISVCRYDNVTNTVEEYLFLSAPVSYQAMKDSVSRLMYTSDSGVFYLMLGDEVHAIDLEAKSDNVLISDLSEGTYCVSENGRYIAWVDAEQEGKAQVLHVTDLNTAQTQDIDADTGTYIRPLGFMESDCIYGLASGNRVDQGESETVEKVRIAAFTDSGYEVLTTYEKSGYLVQSIGVENGTIYLNLIKENQNDGGALTDTITNKEIEESKAVRAERVQSGSKQTQVNLVFAESVENSSPVLKTPKMILPEASTELKLEKEYFTEH